MTRTEVLVPTLRLTLLGAPCWRIGDGGAVRLERRPAAVCAWLALEGPTPKYRLAGLLWPDSGDAAAKANMRQLLHRLRTGGFDGIVGDDRIALRDGVDCDAARRSSIAFGDDRTMLDDDAAELLHGYDYDDAPDFADWLGVNRRMLDELHQRALADDADRLLAAGAYGEALDRVVRSLRRDPLAEASYRRAMRAHYLLGDRAAALAAFARCRQVLADELGTVPMPETHALAREIERGVELPRPTPAAPTVPLAMLRPPVLAGREAAWTAMQAAWDLGQLIVVTGAAGSGKTRLIEDFAASKGETLHIEGRPGDAAVPYSSVARNQRRVLARRPGLSPHAPAAVTGIEPWAWQEAARLDPSLGAAAPPAAISSPADTLRFYDGLMTVYSRAIEGLAALVVDDLHFYDEASIAMSTYAMVRAMPLGARMPHHVVAFREDEVSAQVHETMRQLHAQKIAAWIRLEALDAAAVGTLVRGLGDALPPHAADALASALARYTGGNPLFVLETVRHLHQTGQLEPAGPPDRPAPLPTPRLPLSGKVRELTERRLARLSPAALGLARAAAVLESDFTFEQICEMVGETPFAAAPAWQELEDAQVMAGERFSHDLLLDAVAAGVPHALAGWLHRSAAAMLARRAADPARVARHWLAGGDSRQARHWLLQAAARSRALGRRDDAQAFEQRAAELGDVALGRSPEPDAPAPPASA